MNCSQAWGEPRASHKDEHTALQCTRSRTRRHTTPGALRIPQAPMTVTELSNVWHVLGSREAEGHRGATGERRYISSSPLEARLKILSRPTNLCFSPNKGSQCH